MWSLWTCSHRAETSHDAKVQQRMVLVRAALSRAPPSKPWALCTLAWLPSIRLPNSSPGGTARNALIRSAGGACQHGNANQGNFRATPEVSRVDVRQGFAKPDWTYYHTW
jgi:hypothetical protein